MLKGQSKRNAVKRVRKKSFQEVKELLEDLDSRTLNERAERLTELEPIVINMIERTSSERMDDFIDEASKGYTDGCFRSCIFCCAGAVEHALRHEIIRLSDNPKEIRKNIERKRFEEIIKMAESYELLRPFAEDARYLRRLRNKIAAHPLYIEIEKETTTEDIRTLKSFFDLGEEEREELEKFLKTPEALDEAIEWRIYSERPLLRLVLKAWTKMRKILEGIYPCDT